MILVNKRTLEKLEVFCYELRKKFANEIQVVFASYRQTHLNKFSYKIKDNHSIKQDFYFNLPWNFNHFSNSTRYIEKLLW